MSDIRIRAMCHPVLAGKALKVAVTGGIGVGKSTVSRILEELGARRIDADEIAHQVLKEKAAEIAETFGKPEWKKSINRKKLAEVVFQNPDARLKLEKIVHPAVQQKVQSQFSLLKEGEICIYDVPLLAKNEKQPEDSKTLQYDLIIVVTAPIEERYRRLAARSAMTPAEIDQRIAAQISDQARNEIADVVIKNTGTEAELKDILTKQLWPLLLAATGGDWRQ